MNLFTVYTKKHYTPSISKKFVLIIYVELLYIFEIFYFWFLKLFWVLKLKKKFNNSFSSFSFFGFGFGHHFKHWGQDKALESKCFIDVLLKLLQNSEFLPLLIPLQNSRISFHYILLFWTSFILSWSFSIFF